jgi:hypothetical protein
MKKYYDSVASSVGKPVVGASVQVLVSGTTTVASIFSDAAGSLAIINPILTDGNGYFEFYAADGRYTLVITGPGIVGKTIADIIIDDPLDFLTFTDTGIINSFSATTAGYSQIIQQNKSNSPLASTNWVAANDAASSTTNFAEFGINSSTFTGSGPFSQPNYGYAASGSTPMVVGTYTAQPLIFATNNVEIGRFDSLGNFISNVNTAAPALTVNGQMTFALTSNTNLRISVRGSDGVTRSTNLTLA